MQIQGEGVTVTLPYDAAARRYRSSFCGKPGQTYRLSINFEGRHYEATSTMPSPAPVKSTEFIWQSILNERLVMFEMWAVDPEPDVRNYYWYRMDRISRHPHFDKKPITDAYRWNVFDDRGCPPGLIFRDITCMSERAAEEDEEENWKSILYEGDTLTFQLMTIDLPTYDFFRSVPEENRAALTHYFARRRLVVSLLESILERRLAVQKDGKRNEDERLLHNVLFRQGSENPRQSDLWLLNEEFVYYSGVSNKPLKDVEYKGNKLFVDLSECSLEDREYLISGGENRTRQRPDILLFPEDGKCVIIELKRPDVNISEHLWQVNKYAGLIYAYCALEYKINRFYTYIIGENLNFRDVRNADSSYKPAPNFGYLYGVRSVPADGKPDAEQYMEAHSYSTLLKRAAFRNKTFFDLLFQDGEP